MGTLSEVRGLLEQAAAFERAGDLPAAVTRARAAVRIAADADARDEARLELERLQAEERAWRAAIEARRTAFLARERAEARAWSEDGEAAGPTRPEKRRARRWRRMFAREERQPSAAFAR